MQPPSTPAGDTRVSEALRGLESLTAGSRAEAQASADFVIGRPRKSLAGKFRSEVADLLRPERVIARSMPDASLANIAGSSDARIRREALKEIRKREMWASSAPDAPSSEKKTKSETFRSVGRPLRDLASRVTSALPFMHSQPPSPPASLGNLTAEEGRRFVNLGQRHNSNAPMTPADRITFLTMASQHGRIESRIQAALTEIGDILKTHANSPDEMPRQFLVDTRAGLSSLEGKLTTDQSRARLREAIGVIDAHLSASERGGEQG